MNNFVLFIDGDLQIVPLQDMAADTDFANIVGEVIGDTDTDDPLMALKVPFPASWRDFIWVEMFRGGQIYLSELRRAMSGQVSEKIY